MAAVLIIQTVASVLRRTGFNPTHLKLELTESLMMQDVERTILRPRGIRLCLLLAGDLVEELAALVTRRSHGLTQEAGGQTTPLLA